MTPIALQFGKDRLLLETRSKVLQMAGLSVVNTLTIEECIKRFLSDHFDLIVLCHSLSAEERRPMASFVHRYSPSTPVILMAILDEVDWAMDIVIDCEPQKLITEVRRILGNVEARFWSGRTTVAPKKRDSSWNL